MIETVIDCAIIEDMKAQITQIEALAFTLQSCYLDGHTLTYYETIYMNELIDVLIERAKNVQNVINP